MITAIKRKNIKWWIGAVAFVFLFGFIIFYSYTKMETIVRGVKISAVLEKQNGSSLYKVTGVAKNAISTTLNGREFFIDKDSSFSEFLVLPPGLSVITLSVRDKFDNKREKKFEVFNKVNSQVAINK